MKKRLWVKTTALTMAAILGAVTMAGCSSSGGTKSAPETKAAVPSAEENHADAGASDFPEMTIKLGHGSAPADDDPYHILATNFKKNVEEATGGKVTIEIFPSGQLGGEMDSYEGLGMGTVDMCIATGNIFGLYNNKTTIMDMPFFLEDEAAAEKLLDSTMVAGLLEELSQTTGAVHLGWGSGGFRNIFNNIRPINTPADLSGVKLRVPETTIFVDTFSALGANVTPMTYSETYTGIQQKTIDGIEVPVGNGYTVGFYEVCKYLSMTRHFYNALSISISQNLYDKMTPELQQVLRDAAVKAGQDQRLAVAENEGKQLEAMKEAGIQVNDIADIEEFRKLVKPIYENYKNNISAEIYEEAVNLLGIDE
ncbi:TRAP transporter substrate-binding protein [[Clostridium] symbiosum]|uniref:TRAP transporter substrate-binding protein n=1 Tax=Clostridium symbiosum TaxID=1512 RepID=UPI001D07141A|nr:TRAP transporter substrate-binding protein [[Clostridium] symbiosum]MCB6609866.1 TRAP transporter substrate-binding protein [[Clostridium] symbiosum]MCB6933209.1 TRAP transporter substrate-binding protein [[Clostridium] symbiosum]